MNLYTSLASLTVPSFSGYEVFSQGAALFTEKEGPRRPMVEGNCHRKHPAKLKANVSL